MSQYRLQREYYWIKTLRVVYPYGLSERIKFMNKDSPVGNVYSPFPRYGECFIEKKTQFKITNHYLSSDI